MSDRNKKDWSVDYSKFEQIVEEDEVEEEKEREKQRKEAQKRQEAEMKKQEMEIEDDTILDILKRGTLSVAELYQAVLEMGNPKLIINVYGKLLRSDAPPFTAKQKTDVLRNYVTKTSGIHKLSKLIIDDDQDMQYASLFVIATIEENKQGMGGLLHHKTTLPAVCKYIKTGARKIKLAAIRALGSCFIEICGIPQITYILKAKILGALVPILKEEDYAPAVLFSVLNMCVYLCEPEVIDQCRKQYGDHQIPKLVGENIKRLLKPEESQILLVAMNVICIMLINNMWGTSGKLLEVLGGLPFMENVVKLKKHSVKEVRGFTKRLIEMFQDEETDRNSLILENAKKRVISSCSNQSCASQETIRERFQVCSACKLERYCSSNCQRNDWNKRHKKFCKKRIHVKDDAKLTAERITPESQQKQQQKQEQSG